MAVPKLRFPGFEGEWNKTKLHEITSVITAGKSKISEGDGIYPIIGSTGIIGYTDCYDYEGDFILVARVGANAGKVTSYQGKCKITDNTIFFQSLLGIKIFVEELLIKQNLTKRAFGSGQPLIKASELKELEIHVPSIPEQSKVSVLLKGLNKKIQLQQEKIDLLKEQKKGFMQKIFHNNTWEVEPLKNLVKFFNKDRQPVKENDRTKGIYPYYGASGIIDYIGDYIFEGEYLLLAEDGANIISRNLPMIYKTEGKFWLNNHAHIMQANNPTLQEYLYQYLELINYVPFNTGTAQPKLNNEVVKEIPIPVPTFEQQQKIGQFSSLLDKKVQFEFNKLNILKSQKQAFMQQMFI